MLANKTKLSVPIAALVILAFALAWISAPFGSATGWLSFFSALSLSSALLFGAWKLVAIEGPPKWLLTLLIVAALLRLAMGAVWHLALPDFGYDTPVQAAGYVMEDAYNRDHAAWDLAQSDLALADAFRGLSSTDQYGGLLFLSAGLYRYLGSPSHLPLLILVFTATFSATALLFAWAFAQKVWDLRVAQLAAWGLALYPEAILLGSSQMREALSVALVMLALYGLVRVKEKADATSYSLLLGPLALSTLLSPPFALSLLGLVALTYLGLDGWKVLRERKVWLGLLLIGILALIAALRNVGSEGLWIVQSAEWQAYVSANASGWVARQFERMPLWSQIPFLLIYGIFRPLLPAALIADGLPLWRVVAVWRALGWTVLLALLIYATYLVLRKRQLFKTSGALIISNWVVVLVASYRGGGDLWDNPRYRSAFAGVQLVLAAWAWVEYRQSDDPWLKRAFGGALLMIAWFIPWYLRRYSAFDWPIVELHQVVGLGLASAALYAIWDWLAT
jgi:hypothetical protein